MAKKQKTSPQFEALELLKTFCLKHSPTKSSWKRFTLRARRRSPPKFAWRVSKNSAHARNCRTWRQLSVKEIQKQFEESFGKGAGSVVPHPKKHAATVEVVLDGEVLEGVVKVGTSRRRRRRQDEFKPKYVPFP
jgi:hypothetical protein